MRRAAFSDIPTNGGTKILSEITFSFKLHGVQIFLVHEVLGIGGLCDGGGDGSRRMVAAK